jgi:hypothetical protein
MTDDVVRYLTHPQVQIDPAVPVPQWGLSPVGRARTEAVASDTWLANTTQIVSSGERKAIETAEIIAGPLRRRRSLFRVRAQRAPSPARVAPHGISGPAGLALSPACSADAASSAERISGAKICALAILV